MKAIASFALRRPYTFVVLSILIVVFGIRSLLTTAIDVFPTIKIPVVAAVWSYTGLLPNDVSGRITYYYERALTSTVEGIEHLESGSYYGRNIVKIFFQPGTDVAKAEAEVTAVSQTIVQQLPPGISPPLVMSLDASSVPVMMLQVTSDNMTPAQLFNLAITRLRPQLVTVPGSVIPHPYGGAQNTVLVSLDQQRLRSHKLSAMDVSNAFDTQNIVLPAGDQKIGKVDWMVQTNSVPQTIEDFNNIPIKKIGNAVIRLRDVAWVQQGGPPQTNEVLVKGKQAVMIVIMKGGEASTLDVVNGVKKLIPQMNRTLPAGVNIKILTDASTFVKDSVSDVVRELVLAACLTGLVVLLFLGSWRSTLIIAVSIPLSILSAIMLLHVAGQTINVMTLGGLALAVGILVDNATVMIENIDVHIEHGKPLSTAIVDAAGQMLLPTLIATVCICIVWLPLFQLDGIAGFLFMPLALAIIFAMAPSFVLAHTLVPAMANAMFGKQIEAHKRQHEPGYKPGFFTRFQKGFEKGFLAFRESYRVVLEGAVQRRGVFIAAFLGLAVLSLGLVQYLGRNFFPEIKGGTLQMHMRAPVGTRLEVSAREAVLVNKEISRLLPGQVNDVLDNCGLPVGPHNQAFIPTPTIGTQDCDLTITLHNPESPVWTYRDTLRKGLLKKFPGTEFTFQPAELTDKILNFGLPAPLDVQVSGMDLQGNYDFAKKLVEQLRHVNGIADVSIQQTMTTPTLFIDAKRQFAVGTGVKEADVANNELVSLSGSQQVKQDYWLDPKTGLSYLINIYTPQKSLTSVNDLETIPVSNGDGNPDNKTPELLGAMGTIRTVGTPGEVSHYNILPVVDIYASAEGRDLGAVAADVQKIIDQNQSKLPHGSLMSVRGQADTMNGAYRQLMIGLVFSVLLVYLVLVVNFHSWLDPFIIISALPAALAGIVWSLFVTHTTLSVPALTGTIMCMGTATANSILVVAFARERLAEHGNAVRAAIEAGYVRIRPVVMTALAMIIGMLPMSMSNSQNAPLGRAVIGGLALATVATLLFVPCVFALLHHKKQTTEEKHPTTVEKLATVEVA
jgi:CzcA family heavy metal efflux pump